ncbi:hypothetical protein DPMN_065775 [Dreissena polymorpha]|uniref:Uncharacterized protein n=1 Tax=Dreissena polymorpha TaxID=45954 RepID=A0A9D3YV68_DREPO|nr:hypothetical protein DPMN_065775 [Dreissena polymorpha]
MSSEKHKFVIGLPPMLTVPCVRHASLHEDIEKGGREQTALSHYDFGFESVLYAAVQVDSTGGFVNTKEVFD